MAYIEVPHSATDTQPYRTFNLPNDSSARTLQDLKFPEKGGGFGYLSGNEISSSVRNRFVYWRYSNGGLEVLEDSLDTSLRSGWLKFIFSNTCVLYAEAFERRQHVQMLVCTAGSAVRLLFRHPTTLMKESGAVRSAPSIFHEADSPRQTVVPVRALQQPGQLRCATARVRRSDGTALFAFCLTTGSVLLVEMPAPGADGGEEARTTELRQASVMSKLWSGIVPSFAARADAVAPDAATDAVFLDDGRPTLLATVCRDSKLRVWSVESRDLSAVIDLVDCMQDNVEARALQIKSQGHSLRRSQGGRNGTTVGVHLNFVSRSYIVVFAVDDAAEDVQSCLVPARRMECDPRQDLVDWALVPSAHSVWTLLQSADGYSLSAYDLRQPNSPGGAVAPALFLADVLWGEEEGGDGEGDGGGLTLVSLHQDPQEACLDAVFAPGRFATVAVARALAALRQSCEGAARVGTHTATRAAGSVDALKEEIVALVESKIADSTAELSAAHELSMCEEELSESELLQIRMLHWSEFFASVVDYQRTCVSRPVGLLADPGTGLVGVVRKAGLSLLRPAEPVEICSFLPLPLISRDALAAAAKQPGGADLASPSLLILLRHCRYLQHCVGGQALVQLYAQLELGNEDPSRLASVLLAECLRQEHELEIVRRLSSADRLMEAFMQLTEIAEDLRDAEEASEDSEDDEQIVEAFSHPERFLFASPLAVNCIARSVDCILTARLRLAVSLLLIQQLLTNPSSCASAGDWLSTEMTGRLRGPLRLRIINLIRNLVLMRWLASVRLCSPPQQTFDRVASQLALLGASGADARPCPSDCRRPMLELFFEGPAGEPLRRRLRETGRLDAPPAQGPGEPSQRLWVDVFPVGAALLQAAVCPSSATVVLGIAKFLLARGQIQPLLKMTRLLDGWWQVDPALVSFLRGLGLLNAGQPQRAVYFFVEAISGMTATWGGHNPSCLPTTVLGREALRKPLHLLQVNIALKVMRALEIAEEPLLVVELARRALQWLELPSHLGRPLEETMSERRRDGPVRKSDLEEEEDMEEDEEEDEETQLRGILWTSIFKHELAVGRDDRAFCALLSNPDASSRRDCLRQLIVTLCERRKLEALVQFRYGEMEEEFVAILQSRARAVDLNVYNYYDLLYAFHVHKGNYRGAAAVMYEQAQRVAQEVRSLTGVQQQARAYLAALTALRLVGVDFQWLEPRGEEEAAPAVVELADVEREYALVKARLRVAEMDIDHSMLSAGPLGVSDTCRCLLKLGLYNVALHLFQLFQQPLDPVFEALASRCITLPLATSSAAGSQQHRDLQLEKAILVECLEEVKPGPGYEGLPGTQLAWLLLQAYIEAHPSGNYWRCAVAKLLASGHFPPAWLSAEGRRRHPAALLRLYMQHDEVEAAVALALDCIDDAAARGGGPSVANQEPRWLPYMWIGQLLAALELLAPTHPQCLLMRQRLQSRLDEYFALLEAATKDTATVRQLSSRAQA